MARILIREEQGPMEIKCGEENKWLCRCGLSKDQPWCDGSHNRTRDEEPGKLYVYENGSRREIKDKDFYEPIDDKRRIVEATRRACIEAALAGYDSAAISGLCHEGAWENAISAIRGLDLESIVTGCPASASPKS